LLKRGDWRKHGDELTPGFPTVLDTREPEIKPTATTTGRRLALAKWLTRPENPLVGRAMVNRLWQHHFGRGLVTTPADLGIQGERPTPPELLDWLATELPRRGWSLKQLHRLMVTSTAYRQSASSGQQAGGSDPENRLLSRMNRRRLEGEALADSRLAAGGRLNPAPGGPQR